MHWFFTPFHHFVWHDKRFWEGNEGEETDLWVKLDWSHTIHEVTWCSKSVLRFTSEPNPKFPHLILLSVPCLRHLYGFYQTTFFQKYTKYYWIFIKPLLMPLLSQKFHENLLLFSSISLLKSAKFVVRTCITLALQAYGWYKYDSDVLSDDLWFRLDDDLTHLARLALFRSCANVLVLLERLELLHQLPQRLAIALIEHASSKEESFCALYMLSSD